MSLRDIKSIDIVGKGPDGGYDLFIYDAGDIVDEQERHYLLSQKLLSYAEYVASGQYLEQAVSCADVGAPRFIACSADAETSVEVLVRPLLDSRLT